MKKKMSKNQLVSYFHALSEKPYKEVRQICKAANWKESTVWNEVLDVDMSLNFGMCIDVFMSIFNETGETIRKSAENMIQNDT